MIKQRTFDEIQQSIRNNINDRDQRVDSKPGTFISDVFVQPEADELASAYIDMKILEINQSINTASGYNLDRLGMNYFTYRMAGAKSTARVRFYIENSNKLSLKESDLPEEIYIPVDFEVATTGSLTVDQIVFKTTESAYMTQKQIFDSTYVDEGTGYKYIELPVVCEAMGSGGNVAAGEINSVYSDAIDGIVAISNPLSAVGGKDIESDTSLKMRIMLAVLGASICTKNGYLKWAIQKDNVNDVKVIGAGEDLMYRDGGFINSAGSYSYGRGGMVDIWIRGEMPQEYTLNFDVSDSYKTGKGLTGDYEGIACHDIILPNQPVLNIVSIKSNNTDYVFENADKYGIEYGYDSHSMLTRTYYKDILWDFGTTGSFTDTEYYPMDLVDETEIEILRKQVNKELLELAPEMENIRESLNWYLADYEDLNLYDITPMFRKVSINKTVYKVVAVDKRLNGRTFIKKNNKIYLRVYQEPDYVLVPTPYSEEDKSKSQLGKDLGGSIYATDCIQWTNTGKSKLQSGDTLVITYTTNNLIRFLQSEMDGIRILTADILIRQAKKVDIQVTMNVNIDDTFNSNIIRNTISTAINTFVNSLQKMGSSIEDSEFVALTRGLDGITHVDIDNVTLCKVGQQDVSEIKLEKNEYFNLKDLFLTLTSAGSVDN